MKRGSLELRVKGLSATEDRPDGSREDLDLAGRRLRTQGKGDNLSTDTLGFRHAGVYKTQPLVLPHGFRPVNKCLDPLVTEKLSQIVPPRRAHHIVLVAVEVSRVIEVRQSEITDAGQPPTIEP